MTRPKKKKVFPFFKLEGELVIEPSMGFDGFRSKIIGIRAPHYLIIEHPLPEKDIPVYPWQDPFWARYYHYSLYRFRTRGLRIQWDPSPLLFLSYPDTVERLDLRQDDRKQVFFRASVKATGGMQEAPEMEAIILDLSRTGCLLLADLRHLIDRDVLLSFQVPWTGEHFELRAVVIRCDVSKQGIRCGLRIFQMDQATEKRYLALLETLKSAELKGLLSPH